MGITKFIKEVLQDHTDSFSSKRVVTLASAALILIAFVVDLFTDFTVSQFMYESLMYIVIAGMGFTGAEQFAKNKSSISGDAGTGGSE